MKKIHLLPAIIPPYLFPLTSMMEYGWRAG
jgi:hypothetical protein